MDVNEYSKIERQRIEKMKKITNLYSEATILYQGKLFKGTVISIELKGIKIKEDTKNHLYRWRYVKEIK